MGKRGNGAPLPAPLLCSWFSRWLVSTVVGVCFARPARPKKRTKPVENGL
jgi:hypothetical protein